VIPDLIELENQKKGGSRGRKRKNKMLENARCGLKGKEIKEEKRRPRVTNTGCQKESRRDGRG